MRKIFIVLVLAIFIIGCSPSEKLGKPVVFGVMTDLHANGNYDNLGNILDYFENNEVDAILILGDLALNEKHKSGIKDSVPDELEIYTVLEKTLMRGFPTFVIPGNHETKEAWEKAMAMLKDGDFMGRIKNYDKLFDMTKIRTYDKFDIDLLSLPGCVDPAVTPKDGFIADADELFVLSQRLDDDVLLVGHCPPLNSGKFGIDMLASGEHVGSEHLLDVMRDSGIKFGVFGHIHEAWGAVDINGSRVIPRQVSQSLFLNPGAGYDGKAGLFYYYKMGNKARYEQMATMYLN